MVRNRTSGRNGFGRSGLTYQRRSMVRLQRPNGRRIRPRQLRHNKRRRELGQTHVRDPLEVRRTAPAILVVGAWLTRILGWARRSYSADDAGKEAPYVERKR